MRKWTIIFSLGLVFISNASYCQVFKLPLLMEHYREHRADNEGVTFLEFLYMHYVGNDQTSADDSKDSQLPFKQFDHCLQLSLCHPILKLNLAKVILPATGYSYPIFQHSISESPFKGGSFKPPRSYEHLHFPGTFFITNALRRLSEIIREQGSYPIIP